MEGKIYSVYVDDNRVNEEYLTQTEAEDLALRYTAAGFKDVLVVDETTSETV